MRFASIGIPAAFSSSRCDCGDKRAGFTLIEALVSMALILAFVGTLVPYLFHSRRIMDNAEHRVEAQILLRTLLNAPFDRSHLTNAIRGGEINGLHWRIVVAPMTFDASPSGAAPWTTYHIVASVTFGAGRLVTAETVQLAKSW
jgi:type II secretory pathway pseudopilin PulG